MRCVFCFFPVQGVARHKAGVKASLAASSGKPSQRLLQFTSAGHVLGFKTRAMYVAAGDHLLRVEYIGARKVDPRSVGIEFAESSKQSQVTPLTEVTYPNLWEAVTLTYRTHAGIVAKSAYHVAPHGKVDRIRMRYNAPARMDENGNLIIGSEKAHFCESAPIAWQEEGGKKIPVKVYFRLMGEREVGFDLGEYNPERALVIDPYLTWQTFLGGPMDSGAGGICLDNLGNVYISGVSAATWGAPIRPYSGSGDAFVAKLSNQGILLWNTFLGGLGADWSGDLSLDSWGNIYVTGTSSASWGIPIDAFSGKRDAFVAKLSSLGILIWNSFLGSKNDDFGISVAVDGSGNLFWLAIATPPGAVR